MKQIPLRMLMLCALFAALTAVCTQIAIPVGAVPVTLSLLPLLLASALLPWRYAGLTALVYLLMGLVGLPVFTGMAGGPGKLLGVTGGYIWGYLPCAALSGWLMEKWGRSFWKRCAAMALGVAACYAFGTAWFMLTKHAALWASLTMCVLPFLPGDAVKIALAAGLSTRLAEPLRRATGR